MIVVQSRDHPGAIRNVLVDLTPADLSELRVASAYVTRSGCDLLFNAVRDLVGQAAFDAIPKTLITSADFGLTEPGALKLWSGLPNASVYLSGSEMVNAGTLLPKRAFHPKLYAFNRSQEATCNTLIGSANLTGRGLSVNTEAAWAQWNVAAHDVAAAFEVISHEAIALNADLLAAYEKLRKAKPPSPALAVEVTPLPAPAVAIDESVIPLRIAIQKGIIHPGEFDAMWVQGEALQGGSRNQLELPRGANQFFGFNFHEYDYPHNLTIGMPRLRSGKNAWDDRPLTWHGNNRMERINLPTALQGGFDYSNKAVMFRRLPDESFELVVVPWDSDLAYAWVEASMLRGTLFRLGTVGTNRIVGLL